MTWNSTMNTSTSDDLPHPMFPIQMDGWWTSVVLGSCCIVGVIGHGLVMGSVILHKHMRTVTNIFLFNLSLVDVLHLMTFPFLATEQMLGTWPFGAVVCKIYFLLVGVKFFTGMLTLCIVYSRTCIRLWFVASACCSARAAVFTVLAIWAGSYTLILPITVFATTVMGHGDVGAELSKDPATLLRTEWCTVHWPLHEGVSLLSTTPEGGFLTYMFLVGFILPLGILSLVSCLIAFGVSRGQAPSANQRYTQTERDALLLSIIVFVFVLIWTPQWSLLMYAIPRTHHLPADFAWPMHHLRVLTLCAHAQSAFNPFIIFITDFRFRSSIRTLCTKIPTPPSTPEINRNNNRKESESQDSTVPMYFHDVDTKVDWMALREKAKYGPTLVPVVVARGHRSLEIIAKPAFNPRFSTAW